MLAMETPRSRFAGEPNRLGYDHAQGAETAMNRVQKVFSEAGLKDPGELSRCPNERGAFAYGRRD